MLSSIETPTQKLAETNTKTTVTSSSSSRLMDEASRKTWKQVIRNLGLGKKPITDPVSGTTDSEISLSPNVPMRKDSYDESSVADINQRTEREIQTTQDQRPHQSMSKP